MHKTLTSSAGSFLGGLSEALGAEGVSATMERASPLRQKLKINIPVRLFCGLFRWFFGPSGASARLLAFHTKKIETLGTDKAAYEGLP